MLRNGHISTSISDPILLENLKVLWVVSHWTTNFDGACAKICACFECKTDFVMQNFGTCGLVSGVDKTFVTKPQKVHPYIISRRMSH